MTQGLGHSFNIWFRNQNTKNESYANASEQSFDIIGSIEIITQIRDKTIRQLPAKKSPTKAGNAGDYGRNLGPSRKGSRAMEANYNWKHDGRSDANQQTHQM
jgi:hypothetical protein